MTEYPLQYATTDRIKQTHYNNELPAQTATASFPVPHDALDCPEDIGRSGKQSARVGALPS